jgi:hypothetical protein
MKRSTELRMAVYRLCDLAGVAVDIRPDGGGHFKATLTHGDMQRVVHFSNTPSDRNAIRAVERDVTRAIRSMAEAGAAQRAARAVRLMQYVGIGASSPAQQRRYERRTR